MSAFISPFLIIFQGTLFNSRLKAVFLNSQSSVGISCLIIHQIFSLALDVLNASSDNSLHFARKYVRIFVRGHYLFREAKSFPRAYLEENCEQRGTDNVQGQLSVLIFKPNGDYCLSYSSNIFRNTRSFENWGIFPDIPKF